MHKLLRLPEVIKITGLARSTIYQKVTEALFPASITLGPKSVGWLESDVEAWIQDKINQTPTKRAA